MSAKAPRRRRRGGRVRALVRPRRGRPPMFTTETPVRCVVAALESRHPALPPARVVEHEDVVRGVHRVHRAPLEEPAVRVQLRLPTPKGTSTHFFCRPVSAAGAESGASAMSRGARKDLRGGRRDGPRPRAAEETVARGTARRGGRGRRAVSRKRRGSSPRRVASSETSMTSRQSSRNARARLCSAAMRSLLVFAALQSTPNPHPSAVRLPTHVPRRPSPAPSAPWPSPSPRVATPPPRTTPGPVSARSGSSRVCSRAELPRRPLVTPPRSPAR